MFPPAERARCDAAIAAAQTRVDAIIGSTPGGGVEWYELFPTREERAAQGYADTLQAIRDVYAAALASEEFDETLPDQIVANCEGITQANVDELAAEAVTVGDAVSDALPSAAATFSFLRLVLWAAVIGGAVYLVHNGKSIAKAIGKVAA